MSSITRSSDPALRWASIILASAAAMMAARLAVARAPAIGAELPDILCATSAASSGRPASLVTVLRSDVLNDQPGKRITTSLVKYAPHAFTPRHAHGGPVTAYVLRGHLRSRLGGQPAHDYGPGEMFYEPMGAVHEFVENLSDDEPAELLAIIVHDEGAALTTLLD
jgi:quercetin dioxygenase-like cupin family protein